MIFRENDLLTTSADIFFLLGYIQQHLDFGRAQQDRSDESGQQRLNDDQIDRYPEMEDKMEEKVGYAIG